MQLAKVAGFNRNSVEFEPAVERSVSAVSMAVLVLVISKAFLVGFCSCLMAQSVGRDYQGRLETEHSLERTHGAL